MSTPTPVTVVRPRGTAWDTFGQPVVNFAFRVAMLHTLIPIFTDHSSPGIVACGLLTYLASVFFRPFSDTHWTAQAKRDGL